MRYSLNEATEKGMVLQLVDDSIQACNSNVEKILGITAERMQGWTSLARRWHGEDGSIFESEEHPTVICLRTGTPQSNQIIGFHRSDGELIWLLLDAQPLFKANENLPYAVVTTFTDITQQKLALSQFEPTSESVSLPSDSERKLRTILIVDDNPIDRETYRRYLRADCDCQYNILEAELGEEGLELCQQNLAKIDAILLDFFLPDLDGLEFLRSLQNFCQRIPVIVVTGQGDEAIAVELLKTGADDYLIKDRITAEQLRSTVNNVIQKEQLRIQIKQAEKERLQQVEKERLILQISQSIRRSLKLEEILQSSVEEVKKFLQSDRVVIFRLQPNGNGTVITESVNPQYPAILASSYYDPCFSESYTERFRQGLVTAKTDIYNSDINPCHIELLERFQVRANLVVPILQGENLWGLLIVHHCSAPRRWQQMEIDSLTELTIQLGIAIQQAELYENLQIELRERQQAEKRSLKSQQFIQQIADTMPGLLYIYDAIASENVYLNSQAFDLLGYTKEEIQTIGAEFVPQVVHPEDLARLSQHFERLNSSSAKEVLGFEYRTRHRDGQWRWFYSRDKVFSRTNDGKLHQILGVAQDITERKQAEENLRNSEEQVRLATNAADLGMWFWYLPENRLIWTNKCKALFGISPETQMSYELLLDCLHPDDRDRTNDAVTRALEEKIEYDIEYRIVWSDGSIHWIAAKGRGFYDETGNPVKMMGTAQDITQRKQAQETLRRSEELNRRILDSSNDCIKVLDLQGRLLQMNAGGLKLLEIEDFNNYLNSDWLCFWEGVARQDAKKAIATGKAGGVGKFEGYCPTVKGTPKWWEVIITPILNAMGQVEQLLSISRDITDRKQVEVERERMLARSQQYTRQLQGLTEAALTINSALSLEEVLKAITERARAIVGAHQSMIMVMPDEVSQQAINVISRSDKYAADLDYNQPTDRLGIARFVLQTNRAMRMTQAELEAHPNWQNLDGEIDNSWLANGWLAAPSIGRNGRNFGLIQLLDKYEGEFTEEDEAIVVQLAQLASVAIENARLYEAEQNARTQAEQANRVKDEFLAILSHELRSPLNPILGWTQMLQTYQLDPEKITAALSAIERNAKLLIQLIDDLLDIAKILRGKMTLKIMPIRLNSVIAGAIETVSASAKAKSIAIETNLSNVPLVAGDPTRLQQVIWNLLSNAIKFTPNQGKIVIQVESESDRVRVIVSDTGKGISADFLPYVFEYFRQADASITRNHGGLGLGLSIVRYIVELHGGEVAVDSPGIGQGTTFRVWLPLSKQLQTSEKQKNSSKSNFDLKGVRVLLVDDAPEHVEFLLFALEQQGVRCIIVSSAKDALSALETFKPNVLVSDIAMPDIDGYQFLRLLRSLPGDRGGQIPAIALSAYARDEDRIKALAAGFQQHISKPIEPYLLVAAIAEVLQNK